MKKVILIIVAGLFLNSVVISQPCLPDGITFTLQSQIDSFAINYPNCTEIGGDVKIVGDDISNLDSLLQLTYIKGGLKIGGSLYIPNPNLADISGLSNLDSIGSHLSIISNPLLQNLDGLSSLNSIGGSLNVLNNTSLSSIDGLQNVDPQTIDQLGISYNPLLSNCDVSTICNYLSSPNGKVTIYNNAEGCDSPAEIAENCGIQLTCLPYGDYYFTKQSQLDNFLADYGVCDTIFGNIYVRGEDITDLSGLTNVKTIVGTLSVSGNPRLKSLDGLENLSTVLYYLAIGGFGAPFGETENDSLTDLTALTNLTNVHLSLVIGNNHSLTNLVGLENIVPDSMAHVDIFNNPQLSECAIESVCSFIATGGTLEITNNKTGCNSKEEIEEDCLLSVSNFTSGRSLEIYPNPFTTSTNIEYTLSQSTEVTISFFNQFGKQVDFIQQKQQQGKQQIVWNAEGLPAGIYFSRLQAGDHLSKGKIVKID